MSKFKFWMRDGSMVRTQSCLFRVYFNFSSQIGVVPLLAHFAG